MASPSSSGVRLDTEMNKKAMWPGSSQSLELIAIGGLDMSTGSPAPGTLGRFSP